MAGFVPAFGALAEAEREAALVSLLDDALCAKLAAASCAADAGPQAPPSAAPPRGASPAQQPQGVRCLVSRRSLGACVLTAKRSFWR